ncbi:MAG: hypothetical protein ACO1N2_00720 [Candidatus Saccharimonadota bacterium]
MRKKDKIVIVIGVWSFLIVLGSLFGWQGAAIVWGFVGWLVIAWIMNTVGDLEFEIESLKEDNEHLAKHAFISSKKENLND